MNDNHYYLKLKMNSLQFLKQTLIQDTFETLNILDDTLSFDKIINNEIIGTVLFNEETYTD